jgi:hypothetical protein
MVDLTRAWAALTTNETLGSAMLDPIVGNTANTTVLTSGQQQSLIAAYTY